MQDHLDPVEQPGRVPRTVAPSGPLPPRRTTTIAWGALGFVVGAVFWHFIGFWSFVSDVVLKGHPEDARVVAQAGQDCLELALDRATGRVASIPCPLFAAELAESRVTQRADSLRLAEKRQDRRTRWSILINQEEDAPAPTAKEADVEPVRTER